MRDVVKVWVVVDIVAGHRGHRIGIVGETKGSSSKRVRTHASSPQVIPDNVIGAVILGEAVSQTLGIKVDWELPS